MINEDKGMEVAKDYIDGLKTLETVEKEYFKPLKDIAKATSTIGLMQGFDEDSANKLMENLLNEQKELMTDQESSSIKKELMMQYPVIMSRIQEISSLNCEKIVCSYYSLLSSVLQQMS